MNKEILKAITPWIAGIAFLFLVSIAYFTPVLEGKALQQDDITRFKGMSKEISDYREKTGQEALWTNSMFGGMPAFQISTLYNGNLTRYVNQVMQLGLPHPANLVFLTALGFFILLMVLGISPWLSTIGSVGFAFSSYFFIILVAGHNSKAHAIAFIAPVIAGIILTYRGKYLLGGVLTTLFLALEIGANHLQITYYLLLIILCLGISELVTAIIGKQISGFLKASAVLVVAAILSVGPNFGNLWSTYEYSEATIRGKSELTTEKNNRTSGLDKDYATAWSYGVSETMTLLIPNFRGGSSSGSLSENSEIYKTLVNNQVPNAKQIIQSVPLYWGTQPFTSGPVYAGAIMVFLFVLGLFVVPNRLKWWLLGATLLSIMLAWGHNFNGLTDFFLNHIPGYNKFRAVSMTLVIAEFTIPFLGILALHHLFFGSLEKKEAMKALKISFFITAGICLLCAILPGAFGSFIGPEDAQLKTTGYPDWFISALYLDRESLLRADAIRSFIFITLAAAAIWAVTMDKIKKQYAFIVLIALVLTDMWVVNRRYLNNDNFVRKSQAQVPFEPTPADEVILKDKDPDFRVLNTTVNTFNDASTSYFHKSIGGYHGAKLRRYQELIDNQISKNNMSVLNMLNMKYVIVKDQNKQPMVQVNVNAMGNAWFVNEIKYVDNADAELAALSNFDPGKIAFADKKFADMTGNKSFVKDTNGSVTLTSYSPNQLVYHAKASTDQLAVFSEIYYEKGWKAFVDGKETPHFRADYVLRAMVVPAGDHKIEFKFEPRSYFLGEKISYASSVLIYLLVLGAIIFESRKFLAKK